MSPKEFQVSMVLPTYNEATTIGGLVQRARDHVPGLLKVLSSKMAPTTTPASETRTPGRGCSP